LFAGDLRDQGRNFAAMMTIFVRNLAEPEAVATALRGLGRRHAAYGVEARDYEMVSVALFWALSRALGEAFTDEAEEAWREAYRVLSLGMQGATRGA
jgi:hemoglobin-like flavoprotein